MPSSAWAHDSAMKRSLIVLVAATAIAVRGAAAQQVNVIINQQWSTHCAEVQQMPQVVFSSSFQTQSGGGFSTPWLGHPPFGLSIGENPSVFSTDAQIVTPEDVKQNRRGTVLFSLPRNLHAAAQILQASGWRFHYSQGGCHVTLLIERIWMDPSQIVRCKGQVVVTADPALLAPAEPDPGLSFWHIEQLESLADLRDRGILTEEEFAMEKARILRAR
jgi:hypothetical protein